MATQVDMILTSKDLMRRHASEKDPEMKHFDIGKMHFYRAHSVVYYAPDGRKKILKSRDGQLGWIDYAIHIEWEVLDSEPFPYHFHRQMMGEAYMMCNDCGAKLWSFDGKEDKDIRCPYKGEQARKYGCT